MFNLLPDSLKSQIVTEYKIRRFLVILVFILLLQATLLIFVFPSWIISESKLQDSQTRVSELEKTKIINDPVSVKPIIKSINNELSVIDKSLEYPKIVPILNAVLSKKTSTIKVRQFTYSSNSSSTAQVSIKGISVTRESLVDFKKSLDSLGIFKSVDLPISNYAKDRDIDFSMNITY